MFQCQTCGRGFRTIRMARRANSDGCPACGGMDIDLASPATVYESLARRRNRKSRPVMFHNNELSQPLAHLESDDAAPATRMYR